MVTSESPVGAAYHTAGAIVLCCMMASGVPASGQQAEPEPESTSTQETSEEAGTVAAVGGPSSVAGQIQSDKYVPPTQKGRLLLKKWKKKLEEDYGLSWGVDYFALYQTVNESPGPDDAASGVARLYGTWNVVNRGQRNPGSVVFKVEYRSVLGTDIAPQALGPTAGYAGFTAVPFSDAGALLTNLFWTQSFAENRMAFNAGVVDVTDYIDVFGLVSPWKNFDNLMFSTGPSIPAPNQGLGVVGRYSFTSHYYLVAGLADANGHPEAPEEMFHSFFVDQEYFKHLEVGWVKSWERRYTDKIHAFFWQVDDRKEAGVEGGWGTTLSYSGLLDNGWSTFVRGGYSHDSGALVDRFFSTGAGHQINRGQDYVGLAVGWSRPPTDTTGGQSADQYTAETYYRWEPTPHLEITPSLQVIKDPAYASSEDYLWLGSLRVRVNL